MRISTSFSSRVFVLLIGLVNFLFFCKRLVHVDYVCVFTMFLHMLMPIPWGIDMAIVLALNLSFNLYVDAFIVVKFA